MHVCVHVCALLENFMGWAWMNPTTKRDDRLAGDQKGSWDRSPQCHAAGYRLESPSQSPGNWNENIPTLPGTSSLG